MERSIPNNESVAEKSEGALSISVHTQKDGVVVNFGKQVSWIGLGGAQQTAHFACLLIQHAAELAAIEGIDLQLTLPDSINLQRAQ